MLDTISVSITNALTSFMGFLASPFLAIIKAVTIRFIPSQGLIIDDRITGFLNQMMAWTDLFLGKGFMLSVIAISVPAFITYVSCKTILFIWRVLPLT